MSNEVKRQYLEKIRLRYLKAGKKQKTLILDEFCQVCEISRKHAIKLLAEEAKSERAKRGRKVFYDDNIQAHVVHLWRAMGTICSKKMVAAIPLWLDYYYGITPDERRALQTISSSTIDRVLSKHRASHRRGLSSTEPSMLKNKIPLKLLEDSDVPPGFIEADTVAHCGTSLAGEFINSLTMTDLCSSWTENRAVWKKESKTILAAIRSIEESLPFTVLGFATDNGNEFLNHDLHSYFFDRKNRVEFVRRRPYKKNDNAHVEQKNWTHVRELFGYERFDAESQVEFMNDIYKRLWNPLWNFFTPVMKLKTKTRVGGKIIKTYDEPTTPYQRLINSNMLSEEQLAKLQAQFKKLNPFELKRELDEKLKWFFRIAEIRAKSLLEAG
jgi:hypothetical protein